MTRAITDGKPSSVLFVCLGNICRSPLAEGVFRSLVAERGAARPLIAESAGTGAWHVDAPPDRRAIAKAAENGVDISAQRARKVAPEDFQRFDLILAMDGSNLEALKARAPQPVHHKLHRFMEFACDEPMDVPDPYYGGLDGFETVYRMLLTGCEAVHDRIA